MTTYDHCKNPDCKFNDMPLFVGAICPRCEGIDPPNYMKTAIRESQSDYLRTHNEVGAANKLETSKSNVYPNR